MNRRALLQWLASGAVSLPVWRADLSAAGFGVFAVADAMASRAPSSHALAVERMRQHGVAVVNTEMVDILAVPADQRELLKSIVSSFHVETGSEFAAALLANWDTEIARFSLIMPRDYAKVLAAIERATKEGLPVDEYIMEVAANG